MSNALPQLVADRYRLISPLGQGGMGRVWKARDEVLHRDVAIKELVPPPSLTDDERREMRERSLREARAIARLNNINVVRIFDVLRTDGDPWIVMEYVASKSLQDTLAESGPVPPARAIEIGLGVLGALKAAHKAGVMHRDVKPGNVLLGNDGRVVLTDFGLATIPGDPNVTRTGMVLGSPAYIAPERARDGTAGPEADLWSLGATLYAAVEGKSPYARPSAIATLAALATEPLPPSKNAGPLKPVLQGLLRKDPSERITAEVAERLLRRASGKRSRISLLDGVRRPGPNGPRVPRPTVVPAPRPADRSDPPVMPPAPRTPPAAAAAVAGAGATADADPTAKVTAPPADPTAKLTAPPADPTTKLTRADTAGADAADADPTAKVTGSTAAGLAAADADPSGKADADSTSEAAADPTSKVDVDSAVSTDASPAEEATAVASTRPESTRAESTRAETAQPEVAPREPARPTSVLPVSPPASSGRASIPPQTGAPVDRKRRNLLIGALVAVLLLGLAIVVPLLADGDDPERSGGQAAATTGAPAPSTAPSSAPPPSAGPTSGAPSPTPSATPSADPNALPAGWKLHRDPAGFALPLPDGWVRRNGGQNTIVFDEANGVGELLVQWTNNPQPDAEADWRSKEPDRKNFVTNYKFVSIERCDFWKTCADWEWLEDRDGTRIHVRNRGFVTASNRGYALRWEVAEKDWQAKLADFDRIAKGFVPDRRD
ncbi:protein kinase [Micromonospora krabiensis]|uniref:non-specific serine/threonine protein kinase n=1 Tax=Micromonospora krabiensis TaxID=307121 RepID=A0A1C3N679_9ACTN|nr:serine/threonine-protein kinase [Micromonospora krabiensis]SBV28046.1 Serine/threonine protein kinase [Micromonospora krabiensis]